MIQPPDFCSSTFDPRGDGFFFSSSPPPDIADAKNLHDSNPWVVLSCALARLQQGDFGVFPAVVAALRAYDDLLLAIDVGTLFAHAAPASSMTLLEEIYTEEQLSQYPEMLRQYIEVLCASMRPQFLDTILAWYPTTQDESVRCEAPWDLSNIWEDEPGPIDAGPQLVLDPQYPAPFEQKIRDYEGYERVVREAAARVDPSARYVLGGAPFSVVALAKRMIAHAHAGEDSSRTNFERMVFEANTGISCRDFFTNDERNPKFRPLAAMAILEDFLDDPWSRHFADGQRYFFGHPIPE
jgi:hypothetical protein